METVELGVCGNRGTSAVWARSLMLGEYCLEVFYEIKCFIEGIKTCYN